MMWFLLLLYTAHIEPVFLQGDVNRLILKSGDNPCEGHVKIYHNGNWGYVGNEYWSSNTEQVVCKSIHCGERESSKDSLRGAGLVWLNELKCNGSEGHLWDCENPGWNISVYLSDAMKHIKCTNEIKISLDGFRCAGAVQYYNGQTHSGYFCDDNWGQAEANFLCRKLGCGTAVPQEESMVWKRSKSSGKMMKIQCTDIEHLDNLWQCVTQQSDSCSNPASVTCTGYERLQLIGNGTNVCHGELEKEENGKWSPVTALTKLEVSPDDWCQQMYCGTKVEHSQDDSATQLKCSGNVSVVLKNNNGQRCYGAVHITVNSSDHPVCASQWNKKDAQVVCNELECGDVVSSSSQTNSQTNQHGIMDNVQCSGSESSLWHCRATHTKSFCSSIAYVVCADSMNVRLMDGLGPCAGRVEIQYEGQWRRVAKQGWTDTNSDTVCSQLECGDKGMPANSDKFSQGSGDFLTKAVKCDPDASHISECVTDNSNSRPRETEVAAITCEDHKVVFVVGGNSSCSGRVGIQHGSKTYWLSGSSETWNQDAATTVCRQMQCQEASNHTSSSSADMINDVWDQAYRCSSPTTSLFECENTTLPSDYNDTIATVTCSGNIQVNLTEQCWGNVNVCVGGVCGGVCKDTWTDAKSDMLCENLGCGKRIPDANGSPEKIEVTVKSLHIRPGSTNLNQSSFIMNNEKDGTCNRNPAYVVCSGSVKTRINATRYKCSGNVEAYLEGQWLPVCKDALKDIQTQETICRELGCGQALRMVDYFGPKSAGAPAISQIQCPANGKGSLTACNFASGTDTCTLGALRCSSWSKMELKFHKACSGTVVVHSEGNKSAVCTKGWTETEGHMLCRELGCGNLESNMTTTVHSVWNSNFNCSSVKNPQNIWDCEKQILPEQTKQISITCQDEPKVTLSEGCGGEVKINGIQVCNSSWKDAYSHLVCHERKCSNAVFTTGSPNRPKLGELYQHVRCEDYHQTLGQCDRFKGTCDGYLVSVYCVNNMNFSTSEYCGGVIEVNYRNKREKVCALSFSSEMKKKLCGELGCNGYSPGKGKNSKEKRVKLETTLDCSAGQKDIRHCVSQKHCQDKPAQIYCDKYVEKPPGIKTKPPIVPIILGVVIFLVLVILIVVFVRVCIVKKAKRPMDVSSRVISRKEVEFESGDYEDVTSNANEMEDFHHGKAEVITESEARSTSSFPYDDIDEETEAQPLTFQATTAAASGDKDLHEGVLDQSSDGVTYEVEEPQENYDDIEPSTDITQAKAEVHESPQTTLESIAVAPPSLVRGDEDYLIPGQDG
ncbi:scavenger receptor cysteine-rich type 1 protein M130 [Chaetodon trifascialis]|uniref:scavenger receptor cysteine-rich type 1 protein M130 n=1 Tax=Chaetodon trifascialis TaxID=109706 RepID=UPI0039955E9A